MLDSGSNKCNFDLLTEIFDTFPLSVWRSIRSPRRCRRFSRIRDRAPRTRWTYPPWVCSSERLTAWGCRHNARKGRRSDSWAQSCHKSMTFCRKNVKHMSYFTTIWVFKRAWKLVSSKPTLIGVVKHSNKSSAFIVHLKLRKPPLAFICHPFILVYCRVTYMMVMNNTDGVPIGIFD